MATASANRFAAPRTARDHPKVRARSGARPSASPATVVANDAEVDLDVETENENQAEAETDTVETELDLAPADLGHGLGAAVDTDDRADQDTRLARRDSLGVYMREVRRHPVLSHERQHELAEQYHQTADVKVAHHLVTANLRLVLKIGYEYRSAHHNLLDLVQEGNLGLLRAVDKFDPHRGVKFTSYASWWIRAYMLRFILNNLRMVKLGTTHAQRKLFFNLNKEKERLERMGIKPEHALLAARLDVRETEVAEMERRLGGADLSLDAPVSRDDESRSRIDVMPSAGAPPDEQVARHEFDGMLRSTLEDFASGLATRDRELFNRRWLTDDPETLQEVGARFGISRERTRQIEKRLLRRLRSVLEGRLGADVSLAAFNPADAMAA